MTIAPADHVIITAGLNTPPRNAPIIVRFKLKAGSKDCGGYITGLAQELITDKTARPVPPFPANLPDDTDWTPDQSAPEFQLQGNTIADKKDHENFPWIVIPFPDFWYYKATRHLRLKYTDPCGAEQFIDLGSYRLIRERVDEHNWQIKLEE